MHIHIMPSTSTRGSRAADWLGGPRRLLRDERARGDIQNDEMILDRGEHGSHDVGAQRVVFTVILGDHL